MNIGKTVSSNQSFLTVLKFVLASKTNCSLQLVQPCLHPPTSTVCGLQPSSKKPPPIPSVQKNHILCAPHKVYSYQIKQHLPRHSRLSRKCSPLTLHLYLTQPVLSFSRQLYHLCVFLPPSGSFFLYLCVLHLFPSTCMFSSPHKSFYSQLSHVLEVMLIYKVAIVIF